MQELPGHQELHVLMLGAKATTFGVTKLERLVVHVVPIESHDTQSRLCNKLVIGM